MTACNADRFCERVMADYGVRHSFCRCCGRRMRWLGEGEDGTPDGYCRWCELGHPKRVKIEQPSLFGNKRACASTSEASNE